ncbi:hypothetical protein [Vibrio sp. D431a]|uniref:hypothetical protein n=1 Tax=Vibrio sp. D431a TaxID=2837388 RepID=UPI0025540653|nr:hypothetical protein [Vibrio sp. D431a]MDK9793814.1 hypothetical protein [Vibrio sp. D431a]
MKNSLKAIALTSVLLLTPSTSYAVCSTAGSVIALTGSAMRDMDNLRKAFKSTVVKPVTLQIEVSFANIQNAITSRDMQILEAIKESSALASISKAQIDQVNSELKASFIAEMETERKMFENELIHNDGIKGGTSEQYFRTMCAESKIKKSSFGRTGYLARKDVMKSMLSENEIKTSEIKDTRTVARDAQLNHLKNYCSKKDVEEGVCDEAAPIPYADVMSFVALKPINIDSEGIDPETGYQTEYTYSDFELKAAKDYYSNILRVGALRRPSPSAQENNSVLASRYKQLESALSLANYSFSTSINNRVATDKGVKVPMSRFDTLAYMMTKKSQELEEIGSTQTKKGHLTEMMNQIALRNFFEHEKAQYQERISNLTSALIAVKENSPDRLERIEVLR